LPSPHRGQTKPRRRSAAGARVPDKQGDGHTDFGEGDIRASLPRVEREALKANLALVERITDIANRKNATVGQVALARLLAQKPWIVPIPGTRRLERLDENLGSAEFDPTVEDLAEIDRASARVPVQGDRYPEAMQRMIDR
jgi:aryl-alcohol dehydrogenase-like predicted oxidoreductase